MTRGVYRFRLAAVCLGLVAVVFLQEPGRIAADTKLDLAVSPLSFLNRALQMWDGSGFFGQVQNQAYGYLWPVGPLFAVLNSADVVPWVIQRLWWSLVLLVGFLGFVRLVRLLGVTSSAARVVGGLGYVLSVRMVSELSTVSVEAWPMALAPLMLIPLVLGARGGSPRRWAMRSALVFLMTGSINAVASVAILPIGALFLVTRQRGHRRRALMGWWSLGIVLASVWWIVPLLLLGRYSPPFLDWIEAAAVTTGRNDPTSVLRGATHWVPYLASVDGPVWPAGWQLLSDPLLVLATGAVSLAGFTGLLSRRVPERTFWVLVLSLGVALTGMAHVAASGLGGLWADPVRVLLDGVLAPLRNVHKFQPLVTLPLAVGMAHLLSLVRSGRVLGRQPAGDLRSPRIAAAATLGAGAVVALAAAPLLTGQLVGGRSYAEIPDYWSSAARWLDERSTGRALVIPASSFGVYIWGRTQDEPLQALGGDLWGVRDAVPLSSPGNIRLLDEFERHFETGTGSPGLAPALARSGVRWLVVRNDLNTRATGAPLPGLVHQALKASPGIELTATFGPILTAFDSTTRTIDGGLRRAYPAVEVYAVEPDRRTTIGRVALRDATEVIRATGSSEALVDLLDSGVVADRPVFFAGDDVPEVSIVRDVATDTYRRAEANFGSVRNQYSNTLTDTDPYRSARPVHDYYPVDPTDRVSEARLLGVSSVSASSSGASPFALRGRSAAAQPWAALDGDPRTAWISGDFEPGVGQWWQVDFTDPVAVEDLAVALVGDVRVGQVPVTLTITTDSGAQEVVVDATSDRQLVALDDADPTTSLRITLASVADGGDGQGFGLSEVEIPGVTATRPLVMRPSPADGGLVLASRSMGQEGCLAADTAIVCQPGLASAGEERSGVDRIIDVATGGTYELRARLRPRPGTALDKYLEAPANAMRVSASSQVSSDPAVRAQAAADQQTRTSWIASPLDPRPTLRITLPQEQRVTGLAMQTSPEAPASRPLEVTVTANGLTRTLYTDSEGRVAWPAIDTDSLEVEFGTVNPVRSIESETGASTLLPVGITELVVLGGPDQRMLQPEDAEVTIPCGFGPGLVIDDEQPRETGVRTTAGDILEGTLAEAQGCGPAEVTLSPGLHRVRMAPTQEWTVEEVYLTPIRSGGDVPGVRPPRVLEWDDVNRQVVVPADDRVRLLETTENFNDGWQARLGEVVLRPYRVDGWRQAFLVPAGASGTVTLEYAPNSAYRAGLGAGLVTVLVLIATAALPTRAGRDPDPVAAGDRRRWVVAAPVGAAVLVGGPVGAVAVGFVWCLALVLRGPAERSLRVARIVGLAGLAGALVLQAAFPWPGRIDLGVGFDLMMIIGPALALGSLSVVGSRIGGRAAGSGAPGVAS